MLFSTRFNQKTTLRCCFLLVLNKNYIAMLFSTHFRVKNTLQCSFALETPQHFSWLPLRGTGAAGDWGVLRLNHQTHVRLRCAAAARARGRAAAAATIPPIHMPRRIPRFVLTPIHCYINVATRIYTFNCFIPKANFNYSIINMITIRMTCKQFSLAAFIKIVIISTNQNLGWRINQTIKMIFLSR